MHLHLLNVCKIDNAHDIIYQIRHLVKTFTLLLLFSLLDSICDQLKFVFRINFEIVVYDICV